MFLTDEDLEEMKSKTEDDNDIKDSPPQPLKISPTNDNHTE